MTSFELKDGFLARLVELVTRKRALPPHERALIAICLDLMSQRQLVELSGLIEAEIAKRQAARPARPRKGGAA